jgi:hypothetical protein|tara:strand:+ start:177 stop:536 length:360 start_codon:yes stop_codon:yes gene_type:complete
MKTLNQFLKETAMSVGNGGYTGSGSANVAGYDKYLFPQGIDLLSQDYQTPGQSGLAKWRFSGVYPVQKLSLSDVTNMVDASNKLFNLETSRTQNRIRKTFEQFREDISNKYKEEVDFQK